MNKRILLFSLTVGVLHTSFAQITATTLVVKSNPTAVLSDWANDNSVLTYVVTNMKDITTPLIIKTEIKTTDGTVIATNDLAKAAPFSLPHGTHVYYAKDVMPLETMIFSGSYKTSLVKYGKLPTGNYEITVRMVEAGTYAQASEIQNKFFNLVALQLPILIKPYSNDTLGQKEAQTAVIFRWTPLIPSSSPLPNYHVQVFEVLESQQPVQAVRANQPILDIVLTGQTQYIWRPQLSFIDEPFVKRFIWTIQTLDADNNPLVVTDGNGESRSEPMEFYVRTH